MQLFHFLIVSVSAIGYAPVPQLPAAPSPYGSPLAGVVFPQSRSNVFAQQTPYPNSVDTGNLVGATSPKFSNVTASPPPPQPPQSFDEFSSNVGELDLNWNQLCKEAFFAYLVTVESTTKPTTTVTFVPSHNNIANALTGGDGESFVDSLPQWSENSTSSVVPELATLSRNKEADEEE